MPSPWVVDAKPNPTVPSKGFDGPGILSEETVEELIVAFGPT